MSLLRGRAVLLSLCAATSLLIADARAESLHHAARETHGAEQKAASEQRDVLRENVEAKTDLVKSFDATASHSDLIVPSLPDVTVSFPKTPENKQETQVSSETSGGTALSATQTDAAKADQAGSVQSQYENSSLSALEKLPLPPDATINFTGTDRIAEALAVRTADHGDGKGLRLSPRLPKEIRKSIADYYEKTSFQPIWLSGNNWTPAALAIREELTKAADHALDPVDYPVPDLAIKDDPEALAQAELTLSASVVLYARDARGGRITPSRLSKNITPSLELPKADEILENLSTNQDAANALESFNPQHPGYLALKRKLAEIRQLIPSHTAQEVPRGPVLKVGMRDERVPLIRTRFGLETDNEQDAATYDANIAAAIAAFQKDRGIKVSGDLNDQTVIALGELSDNPRRLEGDIIANMERWRWLPAEMGERHIQVNVPEYEVRVVVEGSVISSSRVIVGKVQSPTPLFSGAMQTVVVNPSWTIPPSIMKNEILPGLARDPDYAAKRGYQVTRARNGNITVRQPPGERNALGHIKFLFPNQHSVYLHDTPNRSLFSLDKRAFSHGCVRVDNPFQFAETVLGKDNWSSQRMRELIGKGERSIKLDVPIPVHLTYFTLAVDDEGNLKRFDDIYGIHKLVRNALNIKG